MAVDSELNAGLMTPDAGNARRQEVATEADFYGSMDGASKFVKGDAIAGVLILVINILGGLILGVVSHGMAMADAAQTYVMLAIGDALVAQIPRSEEHTSDQSLMRISYAVFCLKKKQPKNQTPDQQK